MRVLITGASGSGTTTLGKAFASRHDRAWLATQSGRSDPNVPTQLPGGSVSSL